MRRLLQELSVMTEEVYGITKVFFYVSQQVEPKTRLIAFRNRILHLDILNFEAFIKHNMGVSKFPKTVEDLKIRIAETSTKTDHDIPRKMCPQAEY